MSTSSERDILLCPVGKHTQLFQTHMLIKYKCHFAHDNEGELLWAVVCGRAERFFCYVSDTLIAMHSKRLMLYQKS